MKILLIETCESCPFSEISLQNEFDNLKDVYCGLTGKTHETKRSFCIPDHCPLISEEKFISEKIEDEYYYLKNA